MWINYVVRLSEGVTEVQSYKTELQSYSWVQHKRGGGGEWGPNKRGGWNTRENQISGGVGISVGGGGLILTNDLPDFSIK